MIPILPAILSILGFQRSAKSYGRFSVVSRLARVQFFAFGPTGVAGRYPYGAKAYYRILKRRSASMDFRHVLEVGTPEAKCYRS